MSDHTQSGNRDSIDLSATDFYQLAANRLRVGKTPDAIRRELVSRGLPSNAAQVVVDRAEAAYSRNRRSKALRNMVVGAVAAAAGTTATFVTYAEAVNNRGIYYVFWAAIILGAIQFLWGLIGYARG